MTPEDAENIYNALLKSVATGDYEAATSHERGLMTGALLALESNDITRAKAIAKLALDAQQIPFKRI